MKTLKTRKTARNANAVKSAAANELAGMIIKAGRDTGWIMKALELVLTVKNGERPDEVRFEFEEEEK